MKVFYYFLALTAALIFTSAKISFSSFIGGSYDLKVKFFSPVIKKLLKKGADSSFVYLLINDPNVKFNEKFVKINITGYLKKVDYSKNYNYRSVKACRKFLKDNEQLLDNVENIYKIPKEIITSIVWIESKFGDVTGAYNIAGVFMSAAMADQMQFYNMNMDEIRRQIINDTNEFKRHEKKLSDRTLKKVDWAINELLALNKIHRNATIEVNKIEGSWAGAFGIPQFLPSSFLKCAVDGNQDGIVDLYNIEDAVFSVANYLKKSGWSNSLESKKKAVFQYNNSDSYVDAVLILASKLEEYALKQEDVIEKGEEIR